MPVLDEAARIATRLGELAAQPFAEVIVVDGGSRDETVAIVEAHAGVRVLRAPRGRGGQQNAGARASDADALVFLHADATLPADAHAWIVRTLADPAVVGGAFRVRTVADVGPNWLGPLLRIADI